MDLRRPELQKSIILRHQLVQAVREGWWLLLDEINLAPPEVLERVGGLLESGGESITLVERGDTVAVPRHPGFRLVAAMNPATDAGALGRWVGAVVGGRGGEGDAFAGCWHHSCGPG